MTRTISIDQSKGANLLLSRGEIVLMSEDDVDGCSVEYDQISYNPNTLTRGIAPGDNLLGGR